MMGDFFLWARARLLIWRGAIGVFHLVMYLPYRRQFPMFLQGISATILFS